MVKIIYLYVISISDDHHLVVTLPVGSESLQAGGHIGHPGSATYKYLRCYGGGGHGGGRSCLERIIFRLGNFGYLENFLKIHISLLAVVCKVQHVLLD